MTIPLLKRFIAKATPETRVRARRTVTADPKPQTRARRAVPNPPNRKDRAADARVVAKVGCCATADFRCVLYKGVASERFNLFNIAATRRAVALINVRRRGFARGIRRGVGANVNFFGRERYTVAPSESITPQILNTAILASVFAVGVAFFRPRRGFYGVRSARGDRRRIAVCITIHNRL